MFYSSFEEVKAVTGVTAAQLGFNEDSELKTVVDGWMEQIKDLIDTDRNRDFLAEADNDIGKVPPLVHNVALRMGANMVNYARLQRETRFIRIDDWTVRIIPAMVLSDEIKRDLNKIRRGREFRLAVAKRLDDA